MQKQPEYRFSAVLFEAFYNYENSGMLWNKYYGNDENPSYNLDEFTKQLFEYLINRINEVPITNIKNDRKIVFNELIDCIVKKRVSKLFEIKRVYADGVIGGKNDYETTQKIIGFQIFYNENYFFFPKDICNEFGDYFNDAIYKNRAQAILPTNRGDIKLTCTIDELMSFSIHNIQLTHSYQVGNYKNNFEHLIQPYTLIQNGSKIRTFEYDIVVLDKTNIAIDSCSETYAFDEDKDIEKLVEYSEHLVDFINDNKGLVTNNKIFNV